MLSHNLRRDMTGINWRIAGCQQRNECWLRPLQMEGYRVALGADRFQVAVPSLPRVGAQLVLSLSQDQVPGAFDVGGGEWLAVMPTHSAPKLKRERSHVAVPSPFDGQFRYDRVNPILWLVLFEKHQVVKDRHRRVLGRVESLLVYRHTGWAVVLKYAEHAAPFLRQSGSARQQRG